MHSVWASSWGVAPEILSQCQHELLEVPLKAGREVSAQEGAKTWIGLIVLMFRFLNDKDVFQQVCAVKLTRRLVFQSSSTSSLSGATGAVAGPTIFRLNSDERAISSLAFKVMADPPLCISRVFAAFVEFYSVRHESRNLQCLYHFCHVEVSAIADVSSGESVMLETSLPQAAVLLQFNKVEKPVGTRSVRHPGPNVVRDFADVVFAS